MSSVGPREKGRDAGWRTPMGAMAIGGCARMMALTVAGTRAVQGWPSATAAGCFWLSAAAWSSSAW